MSTLSFKQRDAAKGKKIITSALIVNEYGEFLAVKRADDKSDGGTWGIPGGKKKDREAYEASVCREVKEETGLRVKAIRALMVTDSAERIFYDYVALVTKSDVKLNNEHTDSRWIASLDEWPAPSHPVTAELIQSKRSEIMAFVTKTTNQLTHKL